MALPYENLQEVFGVAVIGSGVVGCAIARMLAINGFGVIVLEKNGNIIGEASAGNSGIFHTGFDAPPGSIEACCMVTGWKEFSTLASMIGLPHKRVGGLVVAWSDEEKEALKGILMKAHQNGVAGAEIVTDVADLLRREPMLSPAAKAAVWVPGEGITDPWLVPAFYLAQAIANGARVMRSFEVVGADYYSTTTPSQHIPSHYWCLRSKSGKAIRARMVINCAGNFGDRVEKLLAKGKKPSFQITPRKGQFVVYDTRSEKQLRTLVLPVPTERTKGVIVFPTVYGHTVVGPTAEDQQERVIATTSEAVAAQLMQRAGELTPHLNSLSHKVVLRYAGLRPATEHRDYQIAFTDPKRMWLTVGGIRSTGLTAALGIAAYVKKVIEDQLKISLQQGITEEKIVSQGRFIVNSLKAQLQNPHTQKVSIGPESFEITHPLTRLRHYGSIPAKL